MTAQPGLSEKRGRWGTKRRVALGVVVVVMLLFGVDVLARVAVEAEVEGRLEALTQLSERPDVKIQGLAFLPQLVRGAFQEVDVTSRNVSSGPLHLERVDAQLFDVRVPFHDVLVRDIQAVGIGHSVVRARLPYSDINAYLETTNRPLTLGRGPDGEVQVTGKIVVGGQSLTASGQVSLSVDDDAVHATPRQINTGNSTLDQATRLLLGDRLSFTLPVSLPYGQKLTAVTPYDEGIDVEAHGTGVVLQQP